MALTPIHMFYPWCCVEVASNTINTSMGQKWQKKHGLSHLTGAYFSLPCFYVEKVEWLNCLTWMVLWPAYLDSDPNEFRSTWTWSSIEMASTVKLKTALFKLVLQNPLLGQFKFHSIWSHVSFQHFWCEKIESWWLDSSNHWQTSSAIGSWCTSIAWPKPVFQIKSQEKVLFGLQNHSWLFSALQEIILLGCFWYDKLIASGWRLNGSKSRPSSLPVVHVLQPNAVFIIQLKTWMTAISKKHGFLICRLTSGSISPCTSIGWFFLFKKKVPCFGVRSFKLTAWAVHHDGPSQNNTFPSLSVCRMITVGSIQVVPCTSKGTFFSSIFSCEKYQWLVGMDWSVNACQCAMQPWTIGTGRTVPAWA